MGCISAALINFQCWIAQISPSWNDGYMLDGKIFKVKGDFGTAGDSPTH